MAHNLYARLLPVIRRMCPVLILLAVLIGRSEAIPPPWELETMKAGADLVAIVKPAKAGPLMNVRGANARVSLRVVKVLKGALPKREGKSAVTLLFNRPTKPVQPGIESMVAGSGHPQPRENRMALAFLRKDSSGDEYYRVVAGSHGYIDLAWRDKEQLKAVERRIEVHRGWCAKIEKAAVREAMLEYYRAALEMARKQADSDETVK